MFSKCECCKHYDKLGSTHSFESGRCRQPEVFKKLSGRGVRGYHTISYAVMVCDPKGDGNFAHFEPKPGAGAACLVQITREPAKAMAVGGRA